MDFRLSSVTDLTRRASCIFHTWIRVVPCREINLSSYPIYQQMSQQGPQKFERSPVELKDVFQQNHSWMSRWKPVVLRPRHATPLYQPSRHGWVGRRANPTASTTLSMSSKTLAPNFCASCIEIIPTGASLLASVDVISFTQKKTASQPNMRLLKIQSWLWMWKRMIPFGLWIMESWFPLRLGVGKAIHELRSWYLTVISVLQWVKPDSSKGNTRSHSLLTVELFSWTFPLDVMTYFGAVRHPPTENHHVIVDTFHASVHILNEQLYRKFTYWANSEWNCSWLVKKLVLDRVQNGKEPFFTSSLTELLEYWTGSALPSILSSPKSH